MRRAGEDAGFLETLDRFVGRGCIAGGVLAGFCMNALVVIVLGEMLSRNLLDISFGFALDLGGWLFVALSFLAFGWVLRERGHIQLTLLLDRLPPKKRTAALLLGNLISLSFCIFFVISIWRNLVQIYRTGITAQSALNVPLYPVWVIILLGTLLLTLQLAVDVLADIRSLQARGIHSGKN